MPKPFSPKVVTANHLLDGDAIYQTETGWSRDVTEAELLTDEAHAELRLIEASQQTEIVVGAYLADMDDVGGKAAPNHFRETFRTTGPSNYFHGKQAGATPGPLNAKEQSLTRV